MFVSLVASLNIKLARAGHYAHAYSLLWATVYVEGVGACRNASKWRGMSVRILEFQDWSFSEASAEHLRCR